MTGRSEEWIAFIFLSDQTITLPDGAIIDEVEVRRFVPATAAMEPARNQPTSDPLPLTMTRQSLDLTRGERQLPKPR